MFVSRLLLLQFWSNEAETLQIVRLWCGVVHITVDVFGGYTQIIFSRVIVCWVLCVMHRPSTLENKYSNIFFYKTIAPTVLKFYMEHDLVPGSQNYKIGSGRISKMAAITKNSKNNKIIFSSRTTGYFWLNFGMEYQWNIGIQNYKSEKNL